MAHLLGYCLAQMVLKGFMYLSSSKGQIFYDITKICTDKFFSSAINVRILLVQNWLLLSKHPVIIPSSQHIKPRSILQGYRYRVSRHPHDGIVYSTWTKIHILFSSSHYTGCSIFNNFWLLGIDLKEETTSYDVFYHQKLWSVNVLNTSYNKCMYVCITKV